LQIDAFPHAPLAQRGVRQRIGNERHTEKIRSYVYQGQTHPINRNRAFRYHTIRQFWGTGNKQAHVLLLAPPLSNAASTVYSPQDNMTIVAAIGPQGALEIHPAARTQETQIGDAGRFWHHLEAQRRPCHRRDREIGAVDGDAVSEMYPFYHWPAVNGKLYHFAAWTH